MHEWRQSDFPGEQRCSSSAHTLTLAATKKLLWSGVVLAASCSPPPVPAQSGPPATPPSAAPAAPPSAASATKVTMTTEEARQIAVQTVVYGLPLVIMDITMRTATNVVSHYGMAAPVNQFAHDACTNVFASPGTRTTGNGPGTFLIAGPD
jgi:hypothetical protein